MTLLLFSTLYNLLNSMNSLFKFLYSFSLILIASSSLAGMEERYDSLYYHARLLSDEANYLESNKYFYKLVEVYKDQNDSLLTLMYKHIGVNFWKLGDYQEAMHYHSMALEIDERMGSKFQIAVSLNNIGLIHWLSKEYDLALESYEESAKTTLETGSEPSLLGNIYNNIGIIYKEKGDYKQSDFYHRKAFAIFKGLSASRWLANSYNNIGILHKLQNNLDSAVHYFNQSLILRKSTNDREGIATSLNNLSETYLLMDKPEKALEDGFKSLGISEEIHSKLRIAEALLNLHNIYAEEGKYDSALYFHRRYLAVKDSIYSQEKANEMAYLQTKMDMRLKDLKIDNLEKEQKLARIKLYYFIALIAVVLAIAGIFIQRQFLNYRKNKKLAEVNLENARKTLSMKEKELKEYLSMIARKNQTIHSLQSQIDTMNGQNTYDLEELIHQRILTEEDWKEYQNRFSEIYPGFFSTLKLSPIHFTEAEIRLLALTKLNLSGKEMADVLGISHQSVRTSKMRLKKKINAYNIEDIESFLKEVN